MPSRKPLLVGIDSGTQSTAACVWSTSGRRLAGARSALPVESPRPGWAEQDPGRWWTSCRRAIRNCLRSVDRRRIAGVGLAFQRETFSLLDAEGRFVRPAILWLDVRATEEVGELEREIGREEYHRRTGKPLDTTSALARLLWLRRHEPEAMAAATLWTDVGAYLAFRLTGELTTSVAGADTCGLVDLERRSWIDSYLARVGLERSRLPALSRPGEVIGRVTRTAARETGFAEGTPVVAAGGDGQVFNVGVGAAEPWSASLTLGTSIVLGLACPEAPISPLFRTLVSASSGHLLECVLQSGTYLLRWFCEGFAGAKRKGEAHWDSEAADMPPGSGGLVTLPNWWGVRFPEYLPEARGVTFGWSNDHGLAHFYRSLLEGLAFELRRAVAELERIFPGKMAKTIRAGGGGAKSRLWLSILADALGRPVSTNREAEATALGAAILAGVGVGLFESVRSASMSMVSERLRVRPDGGRHAVYTELFERVYLPLLAATNPLAGSLRGRSP
jgi:xylulokinase